MNITGLSLTNVRAFEEAEFNFNPGFNLIAGINGAGKSTVLDSIRYCASHLLPAMRGMPFKPFGFSVDDIHESAPFAEATLEVSFHQQEEKHSITLREWREAVAKDDPENIDALRREILNTQRPRTRLRTHLRDLQVSQSPREPEYFYPDRSRLAALAKAEPTSPLIVHYSTSRSSLRDRKERASATALDQAAYYEALAHSKLNLRLAADWLRVQRALAAERHNAGQIVAAIASAIETFLPGYSNLRPADDETSRVLIDRDGMPLNVRQLSDGERSILALVLDLAKRLAQANPRLGTPLANGEAVVLIDEIDLHLHPQWQRKVVANLERTFPKCQFIATTHSPQVIGEVPHEKIQIIDKNLVYTPTHSFGVDSSRVLEELMATRPRTKAVDERLKNIADLIADKKISAARAQIEGLVADLGENDPEVTRVRTLLEFLESDD